MLSAACFSVCHGRLVLGRLHGSRHSKHERLWLHLGDVLPGVERGSGGAKVQHQCRQAVDVEAARQDKPAVLLG